jgi:hypothetical protein
MPRDDGDRQPSRDRGPPRRRTLGVRVTEREWRTVNRLAEEEDTSVDALLRRWGVERLLELARDRGLEAGED